MKEKDDLTDSDEDQLDKTTRREHVSTVSSPSARDTSGTLGNKNKRGRPRLLDNPDEETIAKRLQMRQKQAERRQKKKEEKERKEAAGAKNESVNISMGSQPFHSSVLSQASLPQSGQPMWSSTFPLSGQQNQGQAQWGQPPSGLPQWPQAQWQQPHWSQTTQPQQNETFRDEEEEDYQPPSNNSKMEAWKNSEILLSSKDALGAESLPQEAGMWKTEPPANTVAPADTTDLANTPAPAIIIEPANTAATATEPQNRPLEMNISVEQQLRQQLVQKNIIIADQSQDIARYREQLRVLREDLRNKDRALAESYEKLDNVRKALQ